MPTANWAAMVADCGGRTGCSNGNDPSERPNDPNDSNDSNDPNLNKEGIPCRDDAFLRLLRGARRRRQMPHLPSRPRLVLPVEMKLHVRKATGCRPVRRAVHP